MQPTGQLRGEDHRSYLLKYNVFQDVDRGVMLKVKSVDCFPTQRPRLRREPLSGQDLRKKCYRPALQISKLRGKD